MKLRIRRASGDNTKPHDKAVAKNGGLEDTHWFIEIDTSEELIELISDVHDDIILSNNWGDCDDIPTIVIYDDYIE